MREGTGASAGRFLRARPSGEVPPKGSPAATTGGVCRTGTSWRALWGDSGKPWQNQMPGQRETDRQVPKESAVKRNGRSQKSPDGRLRRSQPSLPE
jgi:hypothetical protein